MKKLNTDTTQISHRRKNARINVVNHLLCLPLEQMISVIQDVLPVELASVYVKLVLPRKVHAVRFLIGVIGSIDFDQVYCFRDISYDIEIAYIIIGNHLLKSKSYVLGCNGNFKGTYGQGAVPSGSDVGTFNDKSLSDCKTLCVATAGCWSIGYHPYQEPSFTNCYLKDRFVTSSSLFKAKDDWTTYYCTTEG